jgi:hypothetical protein
VLLKKLASSQRCLMAEYKKKYTSEEKEKREAEKRVL